MHAQSCSVMSDSVTPWASPLGSTAHGIIPAKIWSGLLFPTPGDLPNPGIEPMSPLPPAIAGGFFTIVSHLGSSPPLAYHSTNTTIFFFFCYRVLVSQPGIQPVPPVVGAQSLNHWTAREVPTNMMEGRTALCQVLVCITEDVRPWACLQEAYIPEQDLEVNEDSLPV